VSERRKKRAPEAHHDFKTSATLRVKLLRQGEENLSMSTDEASRELTELAVDLARIRGCLLRLRDKYTADFPPDMLEGREPASVEYRICASVEHLVEEHMDPLAAEIREMAELTTSRLVQEWEREETARLRSALYQALSQLGGSIEEIAALIEQVRAGLLEPTADIRNPLAAIQAAAETLAEQTARIRSSAEQSAL
jgi:hypothetical protein